jgi:hypothetical protein
MAKFEGEPGLQSASPHRVDSEVFQGFLPRHHPKSRLSGFHLAFHDNVEIGPKMLSRIAKHTGLKPSDL